MSRSDKGVSIRIGVVCIDAKKGTSKHPNCYTLTCDCRSSILESRLSLLMAMDAPAEHPSDMFSSRPRSKSVAETAAEWTMAEVVGVEDGCCCEVVKCGGRLVVFSVVVNASGGRMSSSWWGSC